jgi:FkbM family methyltransferase
MGHVLRVYSKIHGYKFLTTSQVVIVQKDNREIWLRKDNLVYARDVIDEFDSYFGSVKPHASKSGMYIADFSKVRMHEVVDFDLFPVKLPGLPEPMSTVKQYIDLTKMTPGENVLDLGAYAGLTGISFQETVGAAGIVISVEADPTNFECTQINFDSYLALRGVSPRLVNAAIYSTTGFINFSCEAGLGSAVVDVQTRAVKQIVKIPSLTLSELVLRQKLSRIDVIKADIEGAEYAAFSDSEFFANHHPRIIFEPAMNHLPETQLLSLVVLLESYGYKCRVLPQAGSRLPLILAV